MALKTFNIEQWIQFTKMFVKTWSIPIYNWKRCAIFALTENMSRENDNHAANSHVHQENI